MNRAEYDASVLDMARLTRFAQKVARTTRQPKQPPITYETTETIYDTHTERGFLGMGRPKEIRTPRTIVKVIELVGPHWLIDQRQWHLREVSKVGGTRVEEEQHEQIYRVLLPTGEMLMAWTSETTVVNIGGPGRSGLVHQEKGGSSHALSERDVIDLDFEKRYAERTSRRDGREFTNWGDRDPGGFPIRHAKGVGLSIALKKILDGG